MYDSANMKKLKAMRELAPEPMAAFDALNAAVFKDGALTVKVKELIAVAVAVTTQCPYCIEEGEGRRRDRGGTDRGHDGRRGAACRRRGHARYPRDRLTTTDA